MATTFNPLDHPVIYRDPERLTHIPSWHEHIPFAMFLIDVLRPELFVELGTLYGDSYCAFCQAVKTLGTETRCYAIDTWQGDEHAGFQFTEALPDLQAHHDPRYGGFSALIQSSFDEALEQFQDGTIDLLHIDGFHSYEAVRHDFETWRPKLKSRGVVLFHDTNVLERGFGVRRFWDEIRNQYPHFEFTHGHGLGVLAIEKTASPELQALFDATEEEGAAIRALFFHLGNRLALKKQCQLLSDEFERVNQQATASSAKAVEMEKARSAAERDASAIHSQLISITSSNAWKLVARLWRLRSLLSKKQRDAREQ